MVIQENIDFILEQLLGTNYTLIHVVVLLFVIGILVLIFRKRK